MENIRLFDLPLRKDVYDGIMQNLTPVGVGLANHYMQKELIVEGKRLAEYIMELESIVGVKYDFNYTSIKDFIETLVNTFQTANNTDTIVNCYYVVYEKEEAFKCFEKDCYELSKLRNCLC